MSPSEAYPCPMCGAWHGTDSFAVSDKLNEAVKENARLREELADISRAAGYIESDESALEAVQRTIRGWSDRCYSAEGKVAHLWEENAHLRDTIKSYQKADEEIAREEK